jgi:hypothetical protein
VKHAWATAGCLALVACGGAAVPASGERPPVVAAGVSTPPLAPASGLAVAAQPDVELRDGHVAIVGGRSVAFDGIAEGLAWPALARALGPRRAGDVVSIQVPRNVPVQDLLRAAWTVRAADVRVQSPDASGVMRAIELRARRDGPAQSGCHLAVFLRPDGSLRIAAPGGPREIAGEHPPERLARSLEGERAKCPIKYVAFGAESDAAPWGPVFDVVVAIDRTRSAGNARYVLGQAIHGR